MRIGVTPEIVFVASIAAAALLVFVVWVGLHMNRAEREAGAPPLWTILAGFAFVALWAAMAWFRDAGPFMSAFTSVFVGGFMGGGIAYVLLRWVSARRPAAAPPERP